MAQGDLNNSDSGKANKKQGRVSRTVLLWIFIVSILFLALLLVSIYHPHLTGRVKFFTENALSLSVLVIILFQSYIYRRQWEAMQGQLNVMRDQAKVMRETIDENRRSFYVGERAYVGISHIQLIDDFSIEEKPAMQIEIINGGRTPAWNVRMRVRASVEDPTSDKRREHYLSMAEHTETRAITRVLLPSKSELIKIEPNFIVTWDMKMEMYNLSKFFVRGAIHFTDISESEQTLPFCFEWKPTTSYFEDCNRAAAQPEAENPN